MRVDDAGAHPRLRAADNRQVPDRMGGLRADRSDSAGRVDNDDSVVEWLLRTAGPYPPTNGEPSRVSATRSVCARCHTDTMTGRLGRRSGSRCRSSSRAR